MPKIPLQDEVFEVTSPVFWDFLKKWIRAVKDFDIEVIGSHCAGFADFKGRYYPMIFEVTFRQSTVIEQEIESDELLHLFQELLRLTDQVWKFEQETIREYAKEVNLDISIASNRKKFEKKVEKYRFGDTSQGINLLKLESVREISTHSIELIPHIEKITSDIIAEIDKMPII
jgi:hypothetical protein